MTDELHGSHSDESFELPWDRQVNRRDLLKYGGMLGFGAVGASMLASCAPVAELGPSGSGDASPPPAQAKYLVLVIVDACRADYLGYGHLPNIRSMMANGTHYENAFTGIMESTTPACHASMVTGAFPKHDGGILGFWWENPSTKQDYTCADLTDPATATAAIDPTILETMLKDSKTPTLASLLKDVDHKAKVYASSGVKFYAADAAGGPDADYITYFWNDGPNEYRPISVPGHELPAGIIDDPAFRTSNWYTMTTTNPGLQDRLVVDLAIKVVEHERPRIVILNLPEMDWPVAHLYGGPEDAKAVIGLMENADAAFGKLMDAYRRLGIFDQTIFSFLGDHGVLPLERLVNPNTFAQAVTNAGTSLAASDYHTGGFLWLNDPPKAMKVATFLDDLKEPGISAIYFLGEAQGRRQYLPSPATAAAITPQLDMAYRYLLETMNGVNAAHVIMLYHERTGTVGAGGAYPWKGDHGGTSWASQAVAMVMSGPGIRKGYRSRFPARLVDLTPTFLRLMGVPYPHMDGVALADAFTNAQSSELSAQQVLARQLVPVASALKRQSIVDVRAMGATLRQSSSNKSKKPLPLNPRY